MLHLTQYAARVSVHAYYCQHSASPISTPNMFSSVVDTMSFVPELPNMLTVPVSPDMLIVSMSPDMLTVIVSPNMLMVTVCQCHVTCGVDTKCY